MVAIRKSAGFAHILLLIVLVVVIAVVTLTAVKVIQNKKTIQTEREQYAKLDKEARAYVQAINAKYPGKVTHTQNCSYASREGGRGSLGCDVGSSVTYLEGTSAYYNQVIEYADSKMGLLNWGMGRNDREIDALGRDVIKNVIFQQDQNIGCAITYYENEAHLGVDTYCSGNALAEYYPVVGN